MSKVLAPRCSSDSHEPSAGPDWRDVMTGAEETTGAGAAEMERDYFKESSNVIYLLKSCFKEDL